MSVNGSKKLSHEQRYERRQKMASDAAAGKSMSAICKKYKVSSRSVRMACEENGVQLPDRRLKENQSS